MVEQRAFGGGGGLDDVVEAATLNAVGIELGEGGLQNLASGLRGRLDRPSGTHLPSIPTGRYNVNASTGSRPRRLPVAQVLPWMDSSVLLRVLSQVQSSE